MKIAPKEKVTKVTNTSIEKLKNDVAILKKEIVLLSNKINILNIKLKNAINIK